MRDPEAHLVSLSVFKTTQVHTPQQSVLACEYKLHKVLGLVWGLVLRLMSLMVYNKDVYRL